MNSCFKIDSLEEYLKSLEYDVERSIMKDFLRSRENSDFYMYDSDEEINRARVNSAAMKILLI